MISLMSLRRQLEVRTFNENKADDMMDVAVQKVRYVDVSMSDR